MQKQITENALAQWLPQPSLDYCHWCLWGWEYVARGEEVPYTRWFTLSVPAMMTADGRLMIVKCNACRSLCYECGRHTFLYQDQRTGTQLCPMCKNYSEYPYKYLPKPDKGWN